MFDAAALGVVGAENKSADACEGNRRRAHGARLQGDVKIAKGKAGAFRFARTLAQAKHFRMGRGVGKLLRPVAEGGQHIARPAVDKGGADRDFAAFSGGLGLVFGFEKGGEFPCLHGARVQSGPQSVKRGRGSVAANPARSLQSPPMGMPVIGVTLDWEAPGGYSQLPWYALRENYLRVLVDRGAIPFPLPHEPTLVDSYLERIDGLVVTGGNFDIDPAHFGVREKHETVMTKDRRTAFELAMTQKAHAQDLPLLGICGGQQLLNVALGGTLIQHIPDAVKNALAHEQPNPRDEPGHDVTITANTLLHRIVGRARLAVNSAHHQAVLAVPDGLAVNATAPDGVIEGIEDPAKRFCIGVQWHPEYSVSEGDEKIFAAFVAAAAER